MNPKDDERRALVEALLRQMHEQSRTSPERAPFWREGQWRCEFHTDTGDGRLKVFSGDRCVHEERVQGRSLADRSEELRRIVLEGREGGQESGPHE